MNRTSQKRGFNALKVGSIWLFLLLLMAALSLVAVSVGSAGYSLGEILRAVFSGEESTIKVIIFNLRLPRLLLALLIGSSLSASGALLQSVMRNPLADPGTIGVSAGAGTAATTIRSRGGVRRGEVGRGGARRGEAGRNRARRGEAR